MPQAARNLSATCGVLFDPMRQSRKCQDIKRAEREVYQESAEVSFSES
jgi:hypothetical protein